MPSTTTRRRLKVFTMDLPKGKGTPRTCPVRLHPSSDLTDADQEIASPYPFYYARKSGPELVLGPRQAFTRGVRGRIKRQRFGKKARRSGTVARRQLEQREIGVCGAVA